MIEKEGLPFRIGQGYDIHRYDESRPLMLGGVEIGKDRRPFGPLGCGCVSRMPSWMRPGGQQGFPISGTIFPIPILAMRERTAKLMLEVARVLSEEGWQAGNIDSTVIAEKPKLAPHIAEMKASIAHLLGIENQVGVKATTNEKLGAVGRREGMAALASVIIYEK